MIDTTSPQHDAIAPSAHDRLTRARDAYAFIALACAITWLLDLPVALAFIRRQTPPAFALPLAGLGAWGPTLAAVLVASRRREVRSVFRPWRAHPAWIATALFLPGVIHLGATLVEVALGGHPAQWFYPPNKPEYVAALVMFSFGEEFGWRGFGYARLVDRHGPVVGSLILGLGWAIWHLMMSFSPDTGRIEPFGFVAMLIELPLYSVVLAWLLERNGRSLAIAIAFHMGAHLDNVTHGPESEVRLRILRTLFAVIAGIVAARALGRRTRS